MKSFLINKRKKSYDGFDNYLRRLSYGQSCGSNKYNSIQKKKRNDSRIMNHHMMKPSFSSWQCWRHCKYSCNRRESSYQFQKKKSEDLWTGIIHLSRMAYFVWQYSQKGMMSKFPSRWKQKSPVYSSARASEKIKKNKVVR